MSDNGKLTLSDYPNFTQLPTWEQDKVKKAIEKRLRKRKQHEQT